MWLVLLHPEVAARPCGDCRKYQYDDRGPGRMGPRMGRRGNPLPRPPGTPPPCWMCPKIAPGDDPRPENAQELSPHNERAYWHYLECRAVGHFPDDPLVRSHAAVVAAAERHAERVHQTRTGLTVLHSLAGGS